MLKNFVIFTRLVASACDLNYCTYIAYALYSTEHYVTKIPEYNFLIPALPQNNKSILVLPKTTLTDLIVLLSGILGVWFGLNFSSMTISFEILTEIILLSYKKLVTYVAQFLLALILYKQVSQLVSDYSDYNTVMQTDIRYLTTIKPPRVSLCFDYRLLTNTFSANRSLNQLLIKL